jgi:4-hydroxybenzoate polyprenyltransferase
LKGISTIIEMVRLRTTLKYTLTTISGLVLANPPIGFSIVFLILFAWFSSAFGFAINDVSDVEIDKLVKKIRNPISIGKISRKKGILYSLIFLSLSLIFLPLLGFSTKIFGLIYLVLIGTYSVGIRAKAKPILDVLYHGTCFSVLTIMGYIQYRSFDITCLLVAMTVFFLSGMSELLQEIRDYESDKKMITTTVTMLGKKRSLLLCLSFFIIVIFIFFTSSIYGVIPQLFLAFTPLAYFIAAPIIKGIQNEEYQEKMHKKISTRAPLIAILLIASFFLMRYFDILWTII